MKRLITSSLLLIAFSFLTVNVNAQSKNSETNKRVDDYLNLIKQGFSDEEIFQDLGNANFLAENYEAAAFWYEKLLKTDNIDAYDLNYQELYRFALKNSSKKVSDHSSEGQKLSATITAHYSKTKADKAFADVEGRKMKGKVSTIDGYVPSMSITKDGRTAYFSKAVNQKPLYGVFSKKEVIHEIYRAENIDGEWKNVTKLTVCPKYASAKHPTVSEDGKRLFFASNMRGSYGKYDIYVADIKADGSVGISKNLGPKVNTKEDELYPSIYNGTLLFFASEGREGYGGLDLYATQVTQNRLTASVNLGSHINSNRDEYAIQLNPQKGLGYVVSNRGRNHTISQYTVAYGRPVNENSAVASRDVNLQEALDNSSNTEYTSTVFIDD